MSMKNRPYILIHSPGATKTCMVLCLSRDEGLRDSCLDQMDKWGKNTVLSPGTAHVAASTARVYIYRAHFLCWRWWWWWRSGTMMNEIERCGANWGRWCGGMGRVLCQIWWTGAWLLVQVDELKDSSYSLNSFSSRSSLFIYIEHESTAHSFSYICPNLLSWLFSSL
jgi:hypothetical protein